MPLKSTKVNDSHGKAKPNSRLMISPRASRTLTGLGLPATYTLIKAGVIPAIHVGRRFLIPVAALEQALADNALAVSAERRQQNNV
jgi:excisionase family DNA binding protein